MVRSGTARVVIGASVGWLGISMISDGVPTLLLPYRLGEVGAPDATTLGLASLAAILGAALIQPLAGHWSDRVGRRPAILAGLGISGAGLLTLVAAAGPVGLFVGLLATLCGVSVCQAGQQALLPDFVDPSQRGVASGLKGAFDVGGALLGFVALAALLGGGELMLAAGALWAVLAAAALAGVLLLGRERRGLAATGRAATAVRSLNPFAIDWSRHGSLVRLIGARFVFLLGIYTVGRFLFTYVSTRYSLPPEAAAAQAGLILTALAAATVACSIPAGWLADLLGGDRLMRVGGALAALGIGLIPVAPSVLVLVGVGLLIAAGSAAFSSGSWALLSDLAAGPESGRLMGVASLGTAGAAAVAGIFGPLIDGGERVAPGAGYLATFVIAAGAALAGGLLWRSPQRVAAESVAHAQPLEVTQS